MNKNYLKCVRIETAIKRAQSMLKVKAEKNGIYENFGQEEVRNIEEHFIDSSDYSPEMNQKRALLNFFNNWCINYTV